MKKAIKNRSQVLSSSNYFAVLHPVKVLDVNASQARSFVQGLANISPLWFYLTVATLVLYPVWSYAVGSDVSATSLQVLYKWIPVLITKGFVQNVLISFFHINYLPHPVCAMNVPRNS